MVRKKKRDNWEQKEKKQNREVGLNFIPSQLCITKFRAKVVVLLFYILCL